MQLCGDDIYEEDLYDAVEALFERTYSTGGGRQKPYVSMPYDTVIPDYVYLRAYNQIHVVEVKRYASYVRHAVEQLADYPGNFKYVALPLGEYVRCRDETDDCLACEGYGLIVIRYRGRGFRAEFKDRAIHLAGDYSAYYEDYF